MTELVGGEAVERELLFVRVTAAPERRAELVTTAEALGGRFLDVGPDSVVLELTGTPGGGGRVPRAVPPVRCRRPRPHGSCRRPPGVREAQGPRRLAAIN